MAHESTRLCLFQIFEGDAAGQSSAFPPRSTEVSPSSGQLEPTWWIHWHEQRFPTRRSWVRIPSWALWVAAFLSVCPGSLFTNQKNK